jgi:Domain of unknown function (DUF6089)
MLSISKMIYLKNIFFAITFLFILSGSLAQKIEFGIGAGVSHMKGDISPNFNPLQLGVGGNALFRYNLSRSVSLRGQATFLTYNADDLNTNDPLYLYRKKIAKGNIFEAAFMAEYNFLDRTKMVKNVDFIPYLFGGVGYSFINNKSNIFLTDKIKTSTPIIPYGIGFKYRFKGPLTICGEFGTRFTFSDNIDAFSFVNPANGQLTKYYGAKNASNGTTAQNDKLIYGNLTRKDQYYFTNITLTYTIFKLVCPD